MSFHGHAYESSSLTRSSLGLGRVLRQAANADCHTGHPVRGSLESAALAPSRQLHSSCRQWVVAEGARRSCVSERARIEREVTLEIGGLRSQRASLSCDVAVAELLRDPARIADLGVYVLERVGNGAAAETSCDSVSHGCSGEPDN